MKPHSYCRHVILLSAFICSVVGAGSVAYGEPAPASDAELATSDLILAGRVLSVRSAGRGYMEADVHVGKLHKGAINGTHFRYTWAPPEPGLLGEMNHNVFAGLRVKLYLVHERGRYVPWASNSVEWLSDLADEDRVLPRSGEVIYADDIQPPTAGCCRRMRRRGFRCR